MRKKLGIWFVILLIFLLSLGGCGERREMPDVDSVFTKTVNDFAGYRVVDLDGDETTNFVVYQKGVIQLQTGAGVNTLAEADEEARTYRFQNGDDTLKGLKPGDVFFAELPDGSAVAGKVETIRVEGSQVDIQGGELLLGDLFAYVDVSMDIPGSSATVTDIPEGVTAEECGADAGENGPRVVLLSDREQPDTGVAVPLGRRFGGNLSATVGDASPEEGVSFTGATTLSGSWSYTLESLRVDYHYSDEETVFYSGAMVYSQFDWNLNVEGSGTGAYTQPVGRLCIPIPGFPLLAVTGDLGLTVSVSGSLGGSMQTSQRYGEGFEIGADGTQGFYCRKLSENMDPKTTYELDEIKGTMQAGMTVDLSFGSYGAADIYGGLFVGVKTEGKLDLHEILEGDQDAVHDCKVCVDGSVDLVDGVELGAKVGLRGLKEARFSKTFPLQEEDFVKFYLSFGSSGMEEPEFGWGTCPYKRYKTRITVVEEGEKVAGADVHAAFSDGRQADGVTGEDGSVIFYLPNGDNLVKAGKDGMQGTVHVPVDRAPTGAVVELEEKRDLYFVCWFRQAGVLKGPDAETALVEEYRTRYPDAIFLSGEEWDAQQGAAFEMDLNADVKKLSVFGVGLGDIVVYLGMDREDAMYTFASSGERYPCRDRSLNEITVDVGIVLRERSDKPPVLCWACQDRWDFEILCVHFAPEWWELANGAEDYTTDWVTMSQVNQIPLSHYDNMKWDQNFELLEYGQRAPGDLWSERKNLMEGSVLAIEYYADPDRYTIDTVLESIAKAEKYIDILLE